MHVCLFAFDGNVFVCVCNFEKLCVRVRVWHTPCDGPCLCACVCVCTCMCLCLCMRLCVCALVSMLDIDSTCVCGVQFAGPVFVCDWATPASPLPVAGLCGRAVVAVSTAASRRRRRRAENVVAT